MSKWESESIDVNGSETRFLEAGLGPVLVLIHGGGAGADSEVSWKYCIPQYAHNFRVIAVDMVGFGRSARPDPASYSEFVAVTTAFFSDDMFKVPL